MNLESHVWDILMKLFVDTVFCNGLIEGLRVLHFMDVFDHFCF